MEAEEGVGKGKGESGKWKVESGKWKVRVRVRGES
jgi:hypothetical protein